MLPGDMAVKTMVDAHIDAEETLSKATQGIELFENDVPTQMLLTTNL
jgi:hypothetical protein